MTTKAQSQKTYTLTASGDCSNGGVILMLTKVQIDFTRLLASCPQCVCDFLGQDTASKGSGITLLKNIDRVELSQPDLNPMLKLSHSGDGSMAAIHSKTSDIVSVSVFDLWL